MYAYLNGTIVEKGSLYLVLDVQGVGYAIMMPQAFMAKLPPVGETYRIPVSFQVREDEQTLYGFTNEEEKHLFELLITVSGIGPRTGLQMVDKLPPERFAMAILNEDLTSLTSIKGVGKKTAQRMVLELKDKLKDEAWVSEFGAEEQVEIAKEQDAAMQDVAEALAVLGYQANEIRSLMEHYDAEHSIEDNVRAILQMRASKF